MEEPDGIGVPFWDSTKKKERRNHSPHSQLNLVAIIANGQKHGQNSRSKLQMANGAQLHLKGITTNIWPTTPATTTTMPAPTARITTTGQQQFAPFWPKRWHKRRPISIFYALMTSHKNGHIVMHMNEPKEAQDTYQCVNVPGCMYVWVRENDCICQDTRACVWVWRQ